jgi:hypothetical protein
MKIIGAMASAVAVAVAVTLAAPASADPGYVPSPNDDKFVSAITGDGISMDRADAIIDAHALGIGVSFEPGQPLSPVSQQNAVRAAQEHLNVEAYSRKSLIDQLVYENYSTEDATYAVDSINVDWNQQAAKAAKEHLNVEAYSRGSLVDQLVYEGFTSAQAQYGVAAAGL